VKVTRYWTLCGVTGSVPAGTSTRATVNEPRTAPLELTSPVDGPPPRIGTGSAWHCVETFTVTRVGAPANPTEVGAEHADGLVVRQYLTWTFGDPSFGSRSASVKPVTQLRLP